MSSKKLYSCSLSLGPCASAHGCRRVDTGQSARSTSFSLCSCRSSLMIFLFFFAGNFAGNLTGILRDVFRTHKIKAQTFGEYFGAFFVRKFVAQKKYVVPKFALQTTSPRLQTPRVIESPCDCPSSMRALAIQFFSVWESASLVDRDLLCHSLLTPLQWTYVPPCPCRALF